jgi:hypothetical protein
MKSMLLVLTVLSTLTGVSQFAQAQSCQNQSAEKPPVLNCWDHTFAYTLAKVTPAPGNDTLLNVEINGEDQQKFKGLIPGPMRPWGQVTVTFTLEKSGCQSAPGREDLMTCENHRGDIYISYDESNEVRKTLRLRVSDIKFSSVILEAPTSEKPYGILQTSVSYVKLEGDSTVRSATQGFPIGAQSCTPLPGHDQ